jgi:hypothetical protein
VHLLFESGKLKRLYNTSIDDSKVILYVGKTGSDIVRDVNVRIFVCQCQVRGRVYSVYSLCLTVVSWLNGF